MIWIEESQEREGKEDRMKGTGELVRWRLRLIEIEIE